MSTLPPPWDPSDDADERYRRASALDPSRPSETTRRAVLAHAARLAGERSRRAAPRSWLSRAGLTLRRPAVAGTLAAAVLAGVVIAPQFLAPRAPSESRLAPATAPPPAPGAPATEGAAQPAPQEPAPSPVPRESVLPAGPAVTRQRARLPASTGLAPRPAESDRPLAGEATAMAGAAARRAPAPAPAARPAVTPPQEEQLADVRASAPRAVSADPDALRHAAEAGDLAALRTQLARGGGLEARDPQGRTALLLATLHGQTSAVAALLAHGADPSAADAHGVTPLQAAVAADEREIVALLRRYGAR